MLSIIGAGWPRTGTTSLKQALAQLGIAPCYHMHDYLRDAAHRAMWAQAYADRFRDWDRLFAGYQAALDWPASVFWRELRAHYPEARVILTRRDPDEWYESMASTVFRAAQEPTPSTLRLFDGIVDDKAHVLARLARHEEEVQREVPPAQLLVMELGEGWERLCAFLDLPIPAEPYPFKFKREEFRVGRVR
jgi:hypothetical protein